ncbi:hypothetical protein OPKNFCMD_5369 [Methylobacterium crusticola]|uniref:DUF4440 domain-containing protein n=1 Tax=Methylobacterium crusticola TaxID=1697972 RepID=A0ABQ4R4N0_9HYPH|nr:hypothetical protein [Methylobacterium crusticola]GJD52603.1 hypothetical protein OPKNFCMD_5369 [Methylobacterium crusticola]
MRIPTPSPLLGLLVAGALAPSALLPSAALAQGARSWVDPPAKDGAPAAAKPAGPAFAPAPAPRPSRNAAALERPPATPHRVAETRRAPRVGIHAATASRRAARVAREERRSVAPPAPSVAASDDQVRGWAFAAQRLTRDYLASISGTNNATLGAAPGFYGDRVVFHGRPMSVAALMTEKRRFVQRWPDRRYRPRPDSLRTACNAGLATCRVRATVDFVALSPARGARSQGTVDLELAVSFAGGRPVIVAETSRVVHRDQVASGRMPEE